MGESARRLATAALEFKMKDFESIERQKLEAVKEELLKGDLHCKTL